MYDDGKARLIPQPLLGEKDVKFGPWVIIGNSPELYFGIDSVKVYPKNLSMDIIYEDKTTAHVKLQVSSSKNVVEVSNITYDTSNGRPFAIFRSMWVKDGNADVDHIRTEKGEFPIMGEWAKLEGTWWEFFRKVPSIHNTNAPDTKIEVVP